MKHLSPLAIALFVVATANAADWPTHTRDGRERIYGLVSPLDQEGRNFYLLTSEGQVEVRLERDGLVGLLFLQGDVNMQLERREAAIADTAQKFRLPEAGIEVPFPQRDVRIRFASRAESPAPLYERAKQEEP